MTHDASPRPDAIIDSGLRSVPLLFRGKVRDVYDLGDALLLVASDRLSAFDVVLPTPIPGKGRILTQMSLLWFARTEAIAANHVLSRSLGSVLTPSEVARVEGRAMIGVKAQPVPLEAIVRGYLAGSGWAEYQERGSVGGVPLPAGLRESDRLPEPIFTPTTKAAPGRHDESLTFDQAVAIAGGEVAEQMRDIALRVYEAAAAYARERGLYIADTKMELGRLPDGELILIDELLTPDSSRFWDAETYEPGRPQPAFDKQFVRDWLLRSGWNKRPPAPELPSDVVMRTAEKYRAAYERLAD